MNQFVPAPTTTATASLLAESTSIPSEVVIPAVAEVETRVTYFYALEYGVRVDDMAIVIHVYPPGWTREAAALGQWVGNYPKDLTGPLEHAIREKIFPAVPSEDCVKATSTEELSSFCIVATQVAGNPWDVMEEFIDALDRQLGF